MILCDLKDALYLTDQYVKLRNLWAKNLLTDDVNEKETLEWLHEKSVVVLVACEEDEVVGASILYLEKEGEIAIFVKYPMQGIATILLRSMKELARLYQLQYIWGWVEEENIASSTIFLKNGFNEMEKKSRQYKDMIVKGCVYQYGI
jgi:N-acetylglutamate synthase-like GNAT family acetyltransferase